MDYGRSESKAEAFTYHILRDQKGPLSPILRHPGSDMPRGLAIVGCMFQAKNLIRKKYYKEEQHEKESRR
jgi:hypothetical protein